MTKVTRIQEENKTDMGTRIAHYRKGNHLSQVKLGELVGVSRNAVIKWESGKCRPDNELIPKLCNVLGITPNDLFGISNGAAGPTLEEHDLLRKYRQISPFSRRIVDRVIDGILEEEAKDRERALEASTKVIPIISSAASAGDGYGFSEVPTEGYDFFFKNDRNANADSVIRVKGDSMLPVYQDGDQVYVEYCSDVKVGEDILCISKDGVHIKRLGENGPYSLNKDLPFTLTSPDDSVQVKGRVLGKVSPDDCPNVTDRDSLESIWQDQIRSIQRG